VPAPVHLGVPQPAWRYRYYHDMPFMDREFGNGMGDFIAGLKVGLLSEEQGNSLGFALRPWIKIPSARNQQWVRRGRGTGEMDAGFDVILSKNMGPVGTYYNAGLAFIGNPGSNGNDLLDLRDELRLGFGLNVPVTKALQGIIEVNNKTFIGSGTPISGPVNPVDIFGGLRYYPRDWVSIGGGYRHFINSTDTDPASWTYSTDHHGFTVQLAFQRRVNALPVLNCDIQKSTLLEGDSTTLSASGHDKDYNAVLDYKWTATGGRIAGEGTSAT